ncbi:MAG: SIR2 family protein [Acidobacteriota bacterium]|nr:SIR2 family protein [Acidobacteriota bacterium]
MVFQFRDGTIIEDSVFIGDTEFFPVEALRSDEEAYESNFSAWLDQSWFPAQRDLLGEILSISGNRKRYADLSAAVSRRQAVPLVGSGMSVPSGLPTWSHLLRLVSGFTPVDPVSLEELIADFSFEKAADLIAESTNVNMLNERIEHELRVEASAEISGPVRLLPAIFPDLVVTTNLDDVLEYAYSLNGCSFEHVLAGQGIAKYRSIKALGQSLLLKLHGTCRDPEGRVLQTKEYDHAYAEGGLIRDELALLYRTHHLLFIGCSLGNDRTVELVAEVASKDSNMPRHYAFLRLPDDSQVRISREGFLSERNIYPIWYERPHDEALYALFTGLFDSASSGS